MMRFDLILENATIHTQSPVGTVDRLGIVGGMVVGHGADLDGCQAGERLDLGGATVVPGFVDAHTHLATTGSSARAVDVSAAASVEQLLDLVAWGAQERDLRAWVEVVGYDQRRIGRHVTSAELDAAGGGRRVWVKHLGSHCSVVSGSVVDDLTDPAARRRVRSAEGLLYERHQELVKQQRRPYALEDVEAAIRVATQTCLRDGITFVSDAGIGGGLCGFGALDGAAYLNLWRRGELAVRAQVMPSIDTLHEIPHVPGDPGEATLDLGISTGLGNDWLSLGPTKVWFDGGMGVRTAAFTEPYEGMSGHRGHLAGDPEHLKGLVRKAHRSGWEVAIHAIGDLAVDLAIQALREARSDSPRAGWRPRIEHGGLIRPDQVDQLADLGVSIVTQPCFLVDSGDDYAELTGSERAEWLYRGRSLTDAGIRLASSTDRPLPGTPLRAMQFLVERTAESGRSLAPTERMTAQEALASFTTEAAATVGRSERLGSLAVGKWADFAMLSDDPVAVEPDAIGAIQVLATFIEGRRRWPGES